MNKSLLDSNKLAHSFSFNIILFLLKIIETEQFYQPSSFSNISRVFHLLYGLWAPLGKIKLNQFQPSDVFLGGRKDQLLLRKWNSIPESMRNYAQFRRIPHNDKCLSINMEKRTVSKYNELKKLLWDLN